MGGGAFSPSRRNLGLRTRLLQSEGRAASLQGRMGVFWDFTVAVEHTQQALIFAVATFRSLDNANRRQAMSGNTRTCQTQVLKYLQNDRVVALVRNLAALSANLLISKKSIFLAFGQIGEAFAPQYLCWLLQYRAIVRSCCMRDFATISAHQPLCSRADAWSAGLPRSSRQPSPSFCLIF